ncbi:hypothetical protein KY495_16240 [Massilia sp. PAMC28688]|uniref:hypothetical protein n=1 Tax=Massilia sp. PAMC28688 TaxID=2861283 RepID=UPI001C624D35|nr:hypothetical protein [Massilia sp. PAMC28688]QYF92298.1 hypothetical protein KY495_16240 [Massilia sp. PAMC28688]
MKTKDTVQPGFLLTAHSIDAALKTGRRRLYCVECKGLELTQRQRAKPQFHDYWKD